MKRSEEGDMGLSYDEVGSAVQALARVLVDRGHSHEEVCALLTSVTFDEDAFWDVLGPVVDKLAEALGLDPLLKED